MQALFEGLAISYLLYHVMNNSSGLQALTKEKLVDGLKDRVIKFSQISYIEKYKSHYRINIENYNGNFRVEFEKEKLNLLNALYTLGSNRYYSLIDFFKVIEGDEGNTLIGRFLYDYLYSKNNNYEISEFHLSLGEYIINLRRSRIDPEKLKINEYILPDVFSFEEGEVFYHSLLREVKIIKKEVKGKTLTSLLQTKTGMYLFRK